MDPRNPVCVLCKSFICLLLLAWECFAVTPAHRTATERGKHRLPAVESAWSEQFGEPHNASVQAAAYTEGSTGPDAVPFVTSSEPLCDDVGASGFLEGESIADSLTAEIEQLQERIGQMEVKVEPLSKMDSFFQKIDVTGDIRVRQEVDFERNSEPTRNRTRLRVRPGFIFKASEEWQAELRLHTGSVGFGQSVTNPHGDLGQGTGIGFGRHEFSIDRMAIRYSPRWLNGAYFQGGKFGYPMKLNPITAGPMLSQIWDTNVQMEGIVTGQTFENRLNLDSIRLTGGLAPVLTLNDADEASLLYAQIWGEKKLSNEWVAGAGVTYWHWQNLNPDGNATLSTVYNRGNATTGGLFDSEFHIIHPLVTLTYDDKNPSVGLAPIIFSYEVHQNAGAFDANRDFGFLVGAAYGEAMKTKSQWDWAIWYLWMDIQQDAVFSVVSNGDFQLGTNFRGHTFGLIFFPIEGNARVNAGFYSDEPLDPVGGTEKMQWRFRTDVVISF